MASTKKRAIIFGSTGLTGSYVLHEALIGDRYAEVVCFNRRELPVSDPRHRNIVTNFNDLEIYSALFADADVFCCLGTTFKNVNNDREAYYEADVSRPLRAARLAADQKASSFVVQTAMGANARSSIFYNRLKGELEDKLSALPLHALYIFRPSLLTGPRKEQRSGESLGKWVMNFMDPLLLGPFRKYRSIAASDVAKAMVKAALAAKPGKQVYLSDAIQKLADGK